MAFFREFDQSYEGLGNQIGPGLFRTSLHVTPGATDAQTSAGRRGLVREIYIEKFLQSFGLAQKVVQIHSKISFDP